MNFDKWLRNLTEELQDKIEPEAVEKPPIDLGTIYHCETIGHSVADLYSHKDFARNNDNIVVSGEIGPNVINIKDQYTIKVSGEEIITTDVGG